MTRKIVGRREERKLLKIRLISKEAEFISEYLVDDLVADELTLDDLIH